MTTNPEKMCDNWEDWETDNYIIDLNINQLKRLEEQKLIEESEIDLARELIFNNEKMEDDLTLIEMEQTSKFTQITNNYTKKSKPHKTNQKQKENEEKQKLLSKILKEEKIKKKKARDIFGETEEDDEYIEYENKFY